MRLKKLVLDVLFVGVVVLGLLVISQRAKAMYSERLNHNSLSQKAVIFKTKSHQSIQSTIQAIDKTKLNNFQKAPIGKLLDDTIRQILTNISPHAELILQILPIIAE